MPGKSAEEIVLGGPSAIAIGVYGTAKGSCTDVGFTIGGATEEPARTYKDIIVDQHQGKVGKRIIDRFLICRFTVAQATLDNIRLAQDLPAAALVGNTLTRGQRVQTYVTVFLDGPGPTSGNREIWYPKAIINGGGAPYLRDGETVVDFEIDIIWDTAQAVGAEHGTVNDSGVDTTPPTVLLTTPADDGTVAKDAKSPVIWTITEAGGPIDKNTLVYGKNIMIMNDTVRASTVLVAGAITYDSVAKTITFIPTANWTGSDTLQAIVQGIKDIAGNVLATPKIEQFSVAA